MALFDPILQMIAPVYHELLPLTGGEEKRAVLQRFFKTGPGQYGEGDMFLGITVPNVRKVARRHREAPLSLIEGMLRSPWHEMRLCGLLVLVLQAEALDKARAKGKAGAEAQREALVRFYLDHTAAANNWDLVDLSAPTVLGQWLLTHDRSVLDRLAGSDLLWDNRIAMVATLALIRQGQLDDTFRLALRLLRHPHDLMHKAVGWMLREAGKRDEARLVAFVDAHRADMPRTCLRYAIERLPEPVRRELMARPKGK